MMLDLKAIKLRRDYRRNNPKVTNYFQQFFQIERDADEDNLIIEVERLREENKMLRDELKAWENAE